MQQHKEFNIIGLYGTGVKPNFYGPEKLVGQMINLKYRKSCFLQNNWMYEK
jgi:hypothetical protein